MNSYWHVLSVLVTALVTLIPGFAGLVGQPSSEAQTISRTLQWPAGGGGHLNADLRRVRIVGRPETPLEILVNDLFQRVGRLRKAQFQRLGGAVIAIDRGQAGAAGQAGRGGERERHQGGAKGKARPRH